MFIENRVVLGVHVEQIERTRMCSEVFFDVAEESAQQAIFKGMKEMCDQRLLWQRHARCVVFVQNKWSEQRGLLRALPERDVAARDVCKFRIELDTFDA